MLLAVASASPTHAADAAGPKLMKLHQTTWTVNGQPILGTYGAERLEDLQKVKEAGMNVVLSGDKLLDTTTPEGAYCLANGIKVLPHMTPFLYHGVKLREPIAPDQKTIPLYMAGGHATSKSSIIQLDDELIRYEKMTDTELVNCERGIDGTKPAPHREGLILFWPEDCKAEVARIKSSPNLAGYYVLDDSPGDAVSALRAMYKIIKETDPTPNRPVCAGFGDAGSIANLAPGVCDIMFIYWYPVSSRSYGRERTAQEVQHMLTTARRRVPGIPFAGIYQAFNGAPANTGQGVPTPEQLREQLEDFVREGACGLVSFICHTGPDLPGWAELGDLGDAIRATHREIRETGGLMVRPETANMKKNRVQPEGFWTDPKPTPGYVPAWYVLAPFDDRDGKKLDAVFPPDTTIDLNAVYPVKDGTAGWRVRETTCGTLGFAEFSGGQKNAVAYAFFDVTSPTDQTVQMRLCSDDDAVVRVNGREVFRFETAGGLDYDKYIVPVKLVAGTSRVEAKVYNRAGMWGIDMRFTDTQGRPVEGLTFAPAP